MVVILVEDLFNDFNDEVIKDLGQEKATNDRNINNFISENSRINNLISVSEQILTVNYAIY